MEPHTGLNNLDYVVLGIVVLSGFFALWRGFVREMFSLVAWGGAYYASAKYHHLAEPTVGHYIHNQTLIMPVAVVAVFVAVLIVLTIFGMIVSRLVRGEALTAIDRSLGFVFGIIRGALLVSIVYMVAGTVLWPDMDKAPEVQALDQAQAQVQQQEKAPNLPPDWVLQAKTRPAMVYGAKILKTFIPAEDLKNNTKNTQIYIEQEFAKEKAEAQKAIDQKALDIMSTPVPSNGKEPAPPAYDDKNRSSLDQLINQKGK